MQKKPQSKRKTSDSPTSGVEGGKFKRHRRTAKGGIPQQNHFVQMLKNTEVCKAIPKRKIAVLNDTNTVLEALMLLSKFQILSAPVLDMNTKSFLGFVDMLDIVSFTVSLLDCDSMDSNSLFENNQTMLTKQVKHIVDMSQINPVCQVKTSSPLVETVGVFQKGIHRVGVIGEKGNIVNILSQSDVIRFLYAEMENFLSIFDSTVEELSLGNYSPITINQDELTIKALKLMHTKKISALGVVDVDGFLVGNLSASDLKGAVTTDDNSGSDPLGALLLPVLTFLKQGGMSFFPVATCTKKTKFSLILSTIISSKIHRLWIIDESGKPIGLVSLTDIMKALMELKQPERKEVY